MDNCTSPNQKGITMNLNKNILMTRAFNSEKMIISIDDVERGLACHCTCFVCGSELIAKKGDKKKHHFAHSVDCKCDWSGETELHLLAKEVLQIDKQVAFTHLTLDGIPHKINVPFVLVEQEVKLGNLKPDIIGTTINQESMIIEICVTHPCTKSKIINYQKKSINALEISLPPTLLDGVQFIDIDFVREAIKKATIKCVSMNPLSTFFKEITDYNVGIISKQGDDLRVIRNEIFAAKKLLHQVNTDVLASQWQYTQLTSENHKLENSINDWSVTQRETVEKQQRYEYQLNQEIESHKHVIEYREAQKHYALLTEQLKQSYNTEIGKANARIVTYEEDLKKKFSDHPINKEVKRVQLELEKYEYIKKELLADGKILSVEEYIIELNGRYEKQFRTLENHWLIIERLKPTLQTPSFLNSSNTRLPDPVIIKYNTYKNKRN